MRKILLTLISLVALAALVACGGGSSSNTTSIPPSPSGGNPGSFSNASFAGTYVFSVNGVATGNSFATVGTITADGNGNITSGIRDTVNDGGGQTLQTSLVSGTYSVNQDGRVQAVLKWANAASGDDTSGQVIYRFVLQSASAGKLFEISSTADATGRIQLQSSNLASTTPLSGTYIVRLDGEDHNNQFPYGAIGGLNFSGANIAGTIDENDNGNVSQQLALSSGSYAISSGGRGTASYTTSNGTHNFIVYYVSPSQLELISTDKNFFLHGYADQQTLPVGTTAAFVGDQVFSTSGYDNNGGGNLSVPVLETGRLTLTASDAATGSIANAIEDYNDAGVFFTAVAFNGSYSVAGDGRWTANFAYPSSNLNLVGWQVSSQQSVVMMTNSNVANYAILETGTMRAQTTGLSNSNINGNYAEDLSGFNTTGLGNVETTGSFNADGNGNLTGFLDSQSDVSITTDQQQPGSYSVTSNGRSTGAIGSVPVYVYTVDPSTIYLISSDSTRLYQGMLTKQP
jgi:hypothetical protein